jgi:hypothetical protein
MTEHLTNSYTRQRKVFILMGLENIIERLTGHKSGGPWSTREILTWPVKRIREDINIVAISTVFKQITGSISMSLAAMFPNSSLFLGNAIMAGWCFGWLHRFSEPISKLMECNAIRFPRPSLKTHK